MNRSILAVAVGSLLCYTPYSHAEQANDVDETMVVLARSDFSNSIQDIPANVSVITADDIAASGAKNLESLLRARAGIQVSDTNSGPTFALRGFSGEQAAHNTLILVDGRRLNKKDLSSPQLSAILLSQIERVEILSGSAGVLYGDQAVGGVVNIITKSAEQNGVNASVSVGSFDSLAGSIDITQRLNDQWAVFLSASQDNSDNYREHNARDTGVVLGRLSYDHQGTEFFIETSYYDNDREYAGALSLDQFEENPKQAKSDDYSDYSHDITTAVRAGFKHQLNEAWVVSADVIHDDTTGSGSSSDKPIKNSSQNLFGALKLENQFSTHAGKGSALFGLEGANSDFDYKSSFIDRSTEQTTYSVFAQVNVPITNNLVMTTGARYSSIEDELFDVKTYADTETLSEGEDAYELSFNYKLTGTQRIYLRGETNFRFAKTDEQAFTSPDVKGLKPQVGRSIEAGWSLVESDYSLRVDVFNLRLKDEIVFDSSAPAPIGSSWSGANVNADESERNGMSISGDLYATESVLIGVEYSLIDAEFSQGDNKGQQLPWVARNVGRVYSSFDFAQNWQIFIEGVYTGTRFKNGDNSNEKGKMPAYWLGNIALHYNKDDWSTSLRVDNLLDEDYAASAFGYGAYYPGDGRKVTLTAAYHF